ncbi:MAG: 2-oxoglutarate ferredoxin oxidoreductase subunit alpha [Myxococcales bacterium]|nr:2-oxoglutarate ferredoxin oxidoreductase subunit alpha [Myxococcales bacterium]
MDLQPSSKSSSPQSLKEVVIRFAGDSGDGMQLTGTEFTRAAALAGNDIATFPDFPAEIRAPAGTLAGVSGFQLHFASHSIFTPGDAPDVIVAMNAAALKANLNDLKEGGILIVNEGSFTKANLKKAGYEANPLEDGSLDGRRLIAIDMNQLVAKALDETELSPKEVARCKNFWALGLMYWLYSREPAKQIDWIQAKFKRKPELAKANILAFKAGYAYGDATELFQETFEVKSADMPQGRYRRVMGNNALAMGFVAAANKADLPLFLGSYPITPASDILHDLARYKRFGVTTFQAEDEIAAMGAAIGAAYGGALAMATTSGPGLALKGEAMGLAMILELPVVVVNVQRAGPSTGMPTKTEQSDFLQAMYGRNGDCPVAVLAAKSPADCFDTAIEASRIAIKYRCPVIVLSDGYIANGAEPWRMPKPENIPEIDPGFRTDPEGYMPYARNPDTLARDWVRPGTPGLQHRVGGLEKDQLTGDVSYDPENHETMVRLREEKIQNIANDVTEAQVEGAQEGDLLVVGWGGTYGALKQGVAAHLAQGNKVGHLHLRWLSPLPRGLEDIFKRYKKVLVCELNRGQVWRHLRAEYLVPAEKYTKVQGLPFMVSEIKEAIDAHLAK